MNVPSDDDARDERLRSVPYGRSVWVYMIALGLGLGAVSIAFSYFAVRDDEDALFGPAIVFAVPSLVILGFAWRMRALRQSNQ